MLTFLLARARCGSIWLGHCQFSSLNSTKLTLNYTAPDSQAPVTILSAVASTACVKTGPLAPGRDSR